MFIVLRGTTFICTLIFKLWCETVIGIVPCCCHQACCLLYYLGEINNAIHATCTSLPLNPYTSVFGSGRGFEFEQKFWRINEFGKKKKKGTDRRICIPIFTPLQETISSSNTTTPTMTLMVLYWRKMVPFVICRAKNSVSS